MIAAIGWLIFAVLTAGNGYIIWRIFAYYRSTTGTAWGRLLATAKQSRTIFVQYVVIIGGWALSAFDKIASVAQMPELQDWMKANLTPQLVGTVVAGIGLITIVARVKGLVESSWNPQLGLLDAPDANRNTTIDKG